MQLHQLMLQAAPAGGGGIFIVIFVVILIVAIFISKKNKRKSHKKNSPLELGITYIVIGISMIIISQTVKVETNDIPYSSEFTYNQEKQKYVLYMGIGLLLIGGSFLAKGVGAFKKSNETSQTQVIADELLKLKQLLDNDLITQQEFDAQKKKILS